MGADPATRRRVTIAAFLIAIVGTVTAIAALTWWREQQRIARVVEPFGQVAVLGSEEWLERAGKNAVAAKSIAPLERALGERSAASVARQMRERGRDALLVPMSIGDPTAAEPWDPESIRLRLARLDHLPPLVGVHLDPEFAIYKWVDRPHLDGKHAEALGVVARAILAGKPEPALESFPEPLRRFDNVEIIVLLKEGGQSRLWRSARSSSIAKALVTATSAARDRWNAREQAMGKSLATALPRLSIEVALFEDDGTLASTDALFLDRAVTPDHGVAYERRTAWRYTLPDAIDRKKPGGVRRALEELLAGDGLRAESLETGDLRVYRFVLRTLAISAPERLSDLRSLSEVTPASEAPREGR